MPKSQSQTIAARPTRVADFRNENTVWHLAQAGRMDEFHQRYEEALAPCRKAMGKTYTLIIDGKRVKGSDGTFDDTNPANTKELLGKFALASKADAEKAVAAAAKAFPGWSAMDWQKRADIFLRAGDLLREAKYEFAA